MPTTPAPTTTSGSGSRFTPSSTASVAMAMHAVVASTIARRPSTTAAPGDRAGRGGRHAVDERPHARRVLPPRVARREQHGQRVDGHEHARRRGRRAERPGDEVADERDGDHDRARRDHRDGHGVEELPLGEPAVLLHHAAVQERHDGEPAAEHEQPGRREVHEQRAERRRRRRREPGDEPQRCQRQRSRDRLGVRRRARRTDAPPRRARSRRTPTTISRSVHAVTTALTAKSAHSSRSRAIVVRTSFTALRAMIAMTAAPMP